VAQTILSRVSPRRSRRLVAGNALLLGFFVVHALDHAVRQESAVPPGTSAVGAVGLATVLLALGLAVVGHPLAAAATTFVGFATAIGFVVVHVVPDWGPFSQPYPDIPVDDLSWVAMIVPAVVGLVVGGLGLSRLRHAG
jgi:fatty acid desaturase